METVNAGAQATRYTMTWDEARIRADQLSQRLPHSSLMPCKIYGIPRGGSAVAALLGSMIGICLVDDPKEADYFVDDIIDSGETARIYRERFGKETLALVNRSYEGSALQRAWIVFPWDDPKEAGPEDGVRRLLEWIGEDPERDGLKDTPSRVARAMREMTSGYAQDPRVILSRTFDIHCDEMVILNGIRFASLCEHHLLPFSGTASIAYVPKEKVVGISKLARVVECFAKRLQVQERLTQEIADAIVAALDPRGVAVLMRAHHSCIGCRGADQPDSEMVTSSLLGCFRDDGRARMEFLQLARAGA